VDGCGAGGWQPPGLGAALPSSWLANHAITVADGNDRHDRLVLRRWARPGWSLDDPDDTAQREATVLGLLAYAAVPTPALVAADPTGPPATFPRSCSPASPGGHPDRQPPTSPGSWPNLPPPCPPSTP
jgi:hypothetical protein